MGRGQNKNDNLVPLKEYTVPNSAAAYDTPCTGENRRIRPPTTVAHISNNHRLVRHTHFTIWSWLVCNCLPVQRARGFRALRRQISSPDSILVSREWPGECLISDVALPHRLISVIGKFVRLFIDAGSQPWTQSACFWMGPSYAAMRE